MENIKEYSYQKKTIIKLRYYPANNSHDGGWHWECLKGGRKIHDSLKQYAFSSEEKALEHAKEEIDWLLDIDSQETPVLIEG
jgi:hypothetical protein